MKGDEKTLVYKSINFYSNTCLNKTQVSVSTIRYNTNIRHSRWPNFIQYCYLLNEKHAIDKRTSFRRRRNFEQNFLERISPTKKDGAKIKKTWNNS